MALAAVALAAVTLAALTLAAVTLAAVTLCRDPRCPTDIKRFGTVRRLNLNAVLLTSHPFIIVYLMINRSSIMFSAKNERGEGITGRERGVRY